MLAAAVVTLATLFLGASSLIGLQVFAGSTQLVTNEETKGVPNTFWEQYGMNYDSFCDTYKIE